MTFKEYTALDENNQYFHWLANSIQVASYKKTGSHFILYQLDGFYIQLSFIPANMHTALFQVFESTVLLTPYLDTIDISSACYR
jgi:hypothetical protein